MARKLRDALPGGEQLLRAALWAFMRPILSPRLVERNKDAFVFDGGVDSSVDLAAHRADSDLDDLDLGDDGELADGHRAARCATSPPPSGCPTQSSPQAARRAGRAALAGKP